MYNNYVVLSLLWRLYPGEGSERREYGTCSQKQVYKTKSTLNISLIAHSLVQSFLTNKFLIAHKDLDLSFKLKDFQFSLHRLQVLSVEFSCLCILLVYTEHDFHFILGFKLSTQPLFFTLNRDSRKGYLHRQWFSS